MIGTKSQNRNYSLFYFHSASSWNDLVSMIDYICCQMRICINKNLVNNTAIKIKKMTYPSYYFGNEPMRRQPDLKKIRDDTGFYPSIDLKNGLKKFIKYYQ